jgi:predicted nucleic acid-binding protein
VNDRPRLFLDTTVLIALALSTREHPPGRYFFEMAIHGLIDVAVSRDVTNEIEGVLRNRLPDRAPAAVGMIAENLVLARAAIAGFPSEDTIGDCLRITGYRPDAKILAAALETACEVLVTTDADHLLGNPKIGPPAMTPVVMDIQEALDWCRKQISVRSRYDQASLLENKPLQSMTRGRSPTPGGRATH